MNKFFKKAIILFAIAIIVLIGREIVFKLFYTFSTPLTNQMALGQMSGDDAIADTVGRLTAEGKIWYAINWCIGIVDTILAAFGFVSLYKGMKFKTQEGKITKEE